MRSLKYSLEFTKPSETVAKKLFLFFCNVNFCNTYVGLEIGGSALAPLGPYGASIGALGGSIAGGVFGKTFVENMFKKAQPTKISDLQYDVDRGMGSYEHTRALEMYKKQVESIKSFLSK